MRFILGDFEAVLGWDIVNDVQQWNIAISEISNSENKFVVNIPKEKTGSLEDFMINSGILDSIPEKPLVL